MAVEVFVVVVFFLILMCMCCCRRAIGGIFAGAAAGEVAVQRLQLLCARLSVLG